eukprot:TRINITY_DN31390_c0_g1_i1.p1 TRINITY_DN31390_c0_g1~~TRINITY_DN31390_c0_g1_i1.p1  ORF type:complete len:123 (+),score=9.40 TRINITY_DN31390_c0_g1_i1:120-488(+)
MYILCMHHGQNGDRVLMWHRVRRFTFLSYGSHSICMNGEDNIYVERLELSPLASRWRIGEASHRSWDSWENATDDPDSSETSRTLGNREFRRIYLSTWDHSRDGGWCCSSGIPEISSKSYGI